MKTLAIVVGNNNYYQGAELENAVNDAKAMAQVFRCLDYDVSEYVDCRACDYSQLVDDLNERLADYDASIFYYAGHGFEVNGENYLASIECQVTTPTTGDCNRTCLRLTELLDIYSRHPAKLNIMIIDACRRSFARGGGDSFVPMQAPQGTLIAFSTSPDQVSKDGGGQDGHSIYTYALLQYIGREYLSVEDLFKKVRRTVYDLTNGSQIPWEHTSLIGDFVFNTGQLVYSPEIPYDECAVKDSLFREGGLFGSLIDDFRSCNWNRQNPAIHKLNSISPSTLNKNQQFVLGRNLYQSSARAYDVQSFFERLGKNLLKYDDRGDNHVLNGILFEMYFNSKGEFRDRPKAHAYEKVFELRKDPRYARSFDFISTALKSYREQLFYIPSGKDEPIDVNICALNKSCKIVLGKERIFQEVTSVTVGGKDITKDLSFTRGDEATLKKNLSEYFTAPAELIRLHSNIPLQVLYVERSECSV